MSDIGADQCRPAQSFIAQIIIMSAPNQIKRGYRPMVFCHTDRVDCIISYILAKIDRKTGETIECFPESLK